MTIAPHLFPELNVQLLASIPNGIWIEDMGLADDLWVDPVPVRERHDHGAGAAGPWARVQARDLKGLRHEGVSAGPKSFPPTKAPLIAQPSVQPGASTANRGE